MKKITDVSQLDPNGLYTYADYLTWQFEQTVELIKGKLMEMSAPNRKHQRISWLLGGKIYNTFESHDCHAYTAPFDVRLLDKKKSAKANKNVLTVVQPDLCIICDKSKLDEKGCIGAPDLVIEILSVGNSKKEMQIKKDLYEENGIREYWIVDPIRQTLFQYVLQENEIYSLPQIFVNDQIVQSAIFQNLTIDLNEIFDKEEDMI